ncbi:MULTISPECIES: zinc metallopeptidase [unclassified Arcicella]|uniref:zinc metallopeptidase n=1 Tax=unclassified Arcicella TaxID=2644986 RepID=UPI0028653742|nr:MULTISPECIES: zinc metallopeptidase [unclassified Arcicella]MDR6562706.1 Zn-dependent membrane protease YugP [Arcicella sp. BE51]MDR6812949.1 Zn-dependent membrane protease YugP [Arcicella sp. BE140]MDR6824263.1 Zn-dependent membrane protease YugP [Arcicella sp. BE139]
MIGIYLITLVFAGIGMFVQWRLKSKFQQYSEIGLANGLSGQEIADKMLRDNGIYDVRIISVEGQLTDHYNPADKTVNLSPDVYYGRSASAAAVAAHECGHAVQHATAYSMLQFRSSMVPVLSIANNFMPIALMIGMMLLYSTGNKLVLTIGVAMFALATLFSFITLPVEFDASRRALAWMSQRNVVTQREHEMAKDALWWAAMTYVAAALGMLAQLLYYVSLLSGRRSDD